MQRVNIYTAARVDSPVADIAHRLNSVARLVVVLPLRLLSPDRQLLLAAQATLLRKLATLEQALTLADGLLDESRRLARLAELLEQQEGCRDRLATVSNQLKGEPSHD